MFVLSTYLLHVISWCKGKFTSRIPFKQDQFYNDHNYNDHPSNLTVARDPMF